MEGGNRVSHDYLDQLAKFHKQNGHSLNRFPSVDKRPLDLYRLKKTVERKGGFDTVCKAKRWAEVGRDLGYSGKIMSSLSTSLKNSYQKWLLPYEEYLRVAKPGVQHHLEMMNGGPLTPSPAPSPAKKLPPGVPLDIKQENPAVQASNALNASIDGRSPPTSQPPPDSSRPAATGGFTAVNSGGGFTAVNTKSPTPGFTSVNGHGNTSHPNGSAPITPMRMTPTTNGNGSAGPPSSGIAAFKRQHGDLTPEDTDASGRRSKRLKRDTPVIPGSNMLHSRMGASRPQAARERSNHAPGEACEGCSKSDEPNKQLTCEECEQVWHTYCLDPPVKDTPAHGWICPQCLVGNNEYGFEEGDVYSLAGFLRKANEFKQQHFANLPRQYTPSTLR